MKKQREFIFTITLIMVVVAAIAMLALYMIGGFPRKTNIIVAAVCIFLSLLLLVEIIYNSAAQNREAKQRAFDEYIRSHPEEFPDLKEKGYLPDNSDDRIRRPRE